MNYIRHPLRLFVVLGVVGCFVFTQTMNVANTNKIEPHLPIFKEIAVEAGLKFQHYNGMTGKFFLPEIMGAGVAVFDYDNDGDLDVYLAQGSVLEPTDKPGSTTFPWRDAVSPRGRLFRNELQLDKNGARTIRFTDVTEKS